MGIVMEVGERELAFLMDPARGFLLLSEADNRDRFRPGKGGSSGVSGPVTTLSGELTLTAPVPRALAIVEEMGVRPVLRVRFNPVLGAKLDDGPVVAGAVAEAAASVE
jgi:hypothetical protein